MYEYELGCEILWIMLKGKIKYGFVKVCVCLMCFLLCVWVER